jgi:hypothetical protein
VLPTSGKEFRPIQLKSSAAGEKVRPHTVNPWGGQPISSNSQGLYVKYTHQKSSATFLPFFEKSAKNSAAVSSAAEIFIGPEING